MKPKRLEFSGINSFSEKAEIDFTMLLSGGIFGIFGDTGSGKTTILDAIVFALYGRVDRGGTGGERKPPDAIDKDFKVDFVHKKGVM